MTTPKLPTSIDFENMLELGASADLPTNREIIVSLDTGAIEAPDISNFHPMITQVVFRIDPAYAGEEDLDMAKHLVFVIAEDHPGATTKVFAAKPNLPDDLKLYSVLVPAEWEGGTKFPALYDTADDNFGVFRSTSPVGTVYTREQVVEMLDRGWRIMPPSFPTESHPYMPAE